MTRVLHILTDSNIGGAGRYLINYLRFRNREQFDVSVVLPAGSRLLPEVRAMEVPVFEAEGIADRSLSLPAVTGLKKLLREQKPDLVHTHGSFSGRIAAKHCRIPVIYTLGEGMNFCIPINSVKGFIDQIVDNGNVVRPRMGVTVVSIDGPDEAMRRFPPAGAQVYSVESAPRPPGRASRRRTSSPRPTASASRAARTWSTPWTSAARASRWS